MSNSDTKLTTIAEVDVQSAWLSKINWGEVIKVGAAFAAVKGINVPVEVQNELLLTIISVGGLYTWVVKTWFTKTITPGSAASPSVQTSTIVKVLLVAFALSLFLGSRLFAADLPATKAPVAQAYLFGGSGAYFGAYTEVGAAPVSASAPGVAPASLTSTSAAIGLTAGYAHKFANGAVGTIEADICAKNFNGENQGFALSGPLCLEQSAMIYTPTDQVMNAISFLNIPNPFANLANILVPSGATVKNSYLGVGAGLYWNDMTIAYQGAGSNKVWALNPELVVAKMDLLTTNVMLKSFIKTDLESQTAVFGAKQSVARTGVGVRAGVGFNF